MCEQLKWTTSEGGNLYMYRLKPPVDYVNAMITIKAPHELYIYVNSTFIRNETTYDDIDEAKAVAVALVAMQDRP